MSQWCQFTLLRPSNSQNSGLERDCQAPSRPRFMPPTLSRWLLPSLRRRGWSTPTTCPGGPGWMPTTLWGPWASSSRFSGRRSPWWLIRDVFSNETMFHFFLPPLSEIRSPPKATYCWNNHHIHLSSPMPTVSSSLISRTRCQPSPSPRRPSRKAGRGWWGLSAKTTSPPPSGGGLSHANSGMRLAMDMFRNPKKYIFFEL